MGHFVYKYVLNDEIIYIGKCDSDLDIRLSQHGHNGDNIMPEGWDDINNSDIYFCRLANSVMSDVVESELIRRYRPKYNRAKMNTKWDGLEFAEPSWILYKGPINIKTEHPDIYSYKTLRKHYIDIYAIPVAMMMINIMIENIEDGNLIINESSDVDDVDHTKDFTVNSLFDVFYKSDLNLYYPDGSIDISYDYINRKATNYFIKALSTNKHAAFPYKFMKLNHVSVFYNMNKYSKYCKTKAEWTRMFLHDLKRANSILRQEFSRKRNVLKGFKKYVEKAGFDTDESFNFIISDNYFDYIKKLELAFAS